MNQPEIAQDYAVVLNEFNQYSIWPAHRPAPEGWSIVHEAASKEECMTYIRASWTDIGLRPK